MSAHFYQSRQGQLGKYDRMTEAQDACRPGVADVAGGLAWTGCGDAKTAGLNTGGRNTGGPGVLSKGPVYGSSAGPTKEAGCRICAGTAPARSSGTFTRDQEQHSLF